MSKHALNTIANIQRQEGWRPNFPWLASFCLHWSYLTWHHRWVWDVWISQGHERPKVRYKPKWVVTKQMSMYAWDMRDNKSISTVEATPGCCNHPRCTPCSAIVPTARASDHRKVTHGGLPHIASHKPHKWWNEKDNKCWAWKPCTREHTHKHKWPNNDQYGMQRAQVTTHLSCTPNTATVQRIGLDFLRISSTLRVGFTLQNM